MMPLVSVIIPAYNSEMYLGETILSALNQTWKNIEVIVVDDGSADNSVQVASLFAGEKVRVFQQVNKGASAARNRGLAEAKGEYIQFLDGDDLISPNKIEEQVKQLQNNPGYISTCATVHFLDHDDHLDKEVEHYWVSEGSDEPADFLVKLYGGDLVGPQYGGMIAVHSWLSPSSVLDAAGSWNETLSVDDDGEYFCRVIFASKGIKYAPESVNYYRKYKNIGSLSSLNTYKAKWSLLTAAKLKMNHLLARRDDKIVRTALSRIFWEIAVSTYPTYKALTKEARKLAIQLDPKQKPAVYKTFPSKLISDVFGWRAMKLLTVIRQK